MSKLTCIIVEDEPLAVKVLTDYVSQIPFLDLKGTFKDAILAADFLHNHIIDLMFLDLHLPKLKGMDFLRTLKNPPAVIVTTAYHQYAVEGFNLNVTDYLLKPFDFQRFLAAVTKVKSVQDGNRKSKEGEEKKDCMFINVQKKKVKILFSEITYIESQREYVKINTIKKEYISKMSTHEIEALLPMDLFKRVHRSFIIALDKVESFTSNKVEVNGISIPIGKNYRDIIKLF